MSKNNREVMMDKDFLKEQFSTVCRVYQVLAFGVLFYGVLAYWVIRSSDTGVAGGVHTWKYILFAAAMGSVMIVPVFQKRLLSLEAEEEPVPEFVVQKLYKMQMFSLGMCEVPAFIGMVAAIILQTLSVFFIFLIITYAGLYRYRPQWAYWKRYMRKYSY